MYHIVSSKIQKISKNEDIKQNENNNNYKTKFNSKILVIVLIGIIFHLVFTLSIFDIYFRSPLVHGMTPHQIKSKSKVPADRLVLFVADGLRADRFFELEETYGQQQQPTIQTRAPFLRSIIETKGSWGISHTRVPTETRPGHVALIAGFYEDVSAVTKGWKSNPVEFDHLFNETKWSWGYGSPDVVLMFSEHVKTMDAQTYPEEAEDFASDASKLDTWVFDKIEELFKNATRDPELNKRLRSNQIAIFLHLLGLDTNGHAYRPHSREYHDNIRLVDKGIERIHSLIEEFYQHDGKTAYIFTSDHGMSNRGSHGDGERSNTETPLVAWGSGIRGPLPSDLKTEKIASLRGKAKEKLPVDTLTPDNWKLSHLFRSDVSQADIAPLMTSLIGLPSPLNSVGVLPIEILSEETPEYTTSALLANTMQIWEMYQVKSQSKEKSTLLFFSPFSKLKDNFSSKTFERIDELIKQNQFEEAQVLCHNFIELCLEGLNYFQTYDRPFLMTVITLGYFGWIITLSLYVINNYTSIGSNCSIRLLNTEVKKFETISNYLVTIQSFCLFGFLYLTEAPVLYYLYCSFLILFWGKTVPSNCVPLYIFLKDSINQIQSNKGIYSGGQLLSSASGVSTIGNISIIKNFVILVLAAVSVMELLVVSYFYRGVLSLLYALVGFISIVTFYKNETSKLKLCWFVSCLMMSIFPLLPIDYGNDTKLVCFGGILIFILSILNYSFNLFTGNSSKTIANKSSSSSSLTSSMINSILMVCILLSSYIVYSTDSSLEKKIGLPYLNQMLSWILLVSSFVVLSIYRGKGFYDHWTFLCLGISLPFLLLSISYEVLFFGCLILNLTLWMYFELKTDSRLYPKLISITNNLDPSTSLSISKSAIKSNSINDINITQQDIKRAILYIFFCYVGFFGVGNIASISSFEISSTYRFTTIFSPFLMGALLITKIFIPLLLVAVSFALLNNSLNVPRPGSFLIVIALTDIMSINFFFLVKDTGSWLEIGTSISHYGISNGFIILQLLLFSFSSLLVPTTLKHNNSNINQKRI